MNEKSADQAAIIIQKNIRGFFSRKKWSLKSLTESEMTEYAVLIKGNDPSTISLPKEANIFIGTSGWRSIQLACHSSKGTPKLVIIDNSKHVVEFWRQCRKSIAQSTNTQTFFALLQPYINNGVPRKFRNNSMPYTYISNIFEQYSFEKIKQMLSNCTVINQSWGHQPTFELLKKIYVDKTIYVYPSNIYAYLYDMNRTIEAETMLKNIELLNPKLAIHSNLINRRPSCFYLIGDHNPQEVSKRILSVISNTTLPNYIDRSSLSFLN